MMMMIEGAVFIITAYILQQNQRFQRKPVYHNLFQYECSICSLSVEFLLDDFSPLSKYLSQCAVRSLSALRIKTYIYQ